MEVRIETLNVKKFVGIRHHMNLLEDTTAQLWRGFMPRRKEINNVVGIELYSIQVFPDTYFNSFSLYKKFEKWAAVEVTAAGKAPEGMEVISVPLGLYAVFVHKGTIMEGNIALQNIFKKWIPHSNYEVDLRPHITIMGEKYKHDDPQSEEEFWIPMKAK